MTTVDLPEGTHEYKFIADGQWLHDPNRVSIVCSVVVEFEGGSLAPMKCAYPVVL